MPDRYYQTNALNAIDNEYTAGINRQLLCMATGTGKTEVFVKIPDRLKAKLPGQTMVLLHRDELAQQAINKFRLRNPHLNVQQEAGVEKCDPTSADVIVASVQTIGRKDTERVNKFNWPNITKLIVDEAHRGIADSYFNVYNAGGFLNDKKLLLGCTATPTRGDGQGLAQLFQKIVYTYSLRQAIEDGYLVDIRGIRVDTDNSLDGVSTKGGDYDQKELADAVDNPARNILVAKAYLANCGGRRAIGFGVDIAHSQHLAEVFRGMGIEAEAVWGADPDRDYKVKAFRNGDITVLFNAQLLTEGFDMAEIECVILAAPTKSGVVFSQRVGRGTRLYLPNEWDNLKEYEKYLLTEKKDLSILFPNSKRSYKTDVIILDVCDSSSRHSLVTLPTLLGLPSGMNMRGRSLTGTCKAIETTLEKYPHLDFSTLKDADKIEAFVESVNLFEVKFPSEVEKNSTFTWHPAYSGGYLLMLPEKDEVRIEQNLLDKWTVRGTIKGKKYRGERDTMDAAFSAADDLVRKVVPEAIKLVDRDAKWHNDPPTEPQMKLLKKLYKGKQIPTNLTKGEASKLIGSALASKG